jgi:hypothetical protein
VPAAQPLSPLPSLFLLGGIAQVAMTLPVFAAPFVAKEFGLSDRDLALVSGVIALGSFGLSRLRAWPTGTAGGPFCARASLRWHPSRCSPPSRPASCSTSQHS